MESSDVRSILIVANRTAATPELIEEVRRRARSDPTRPARFALLVPRAYWDPDTEESAITLELALPLLDEAAGGHVEGLIGDNDPFAALSGAVDSGDYDEIIISTLPAHISRWLHLDLPARARRLGLPVTVITAHKRDQAEMTQPEVGAGGSPL